MQICSINTQQETPKDLPVDDDRGKKISFICGPESSWYDADWEQVSSLDVEAVIDAYENDFEYCFCKEGTYHNGL